jgi:hypothetical protein
MNDEERGPLNGLTAAEEEVKFAAVANCKHSAQDWRSVGGKIYCDECHPLPKATDSAHGWGYRDGLGCWADIIFSHGEQIGRLIAFEDGRWRVEAFPVGDPFKINVLASGTSMSLKHGKQIAEAVWKLSRNGEP